MAPRPHPLGVTSHPEWDDVTTRWRKLNLAERARRDDPEREPSGFHIALAILGCIVIAASLFSAVL